MMATKATIKIDYDKTMRQVIKLEEIASKVDALGNKHLEDILQGLSASWKGDSASRYLQKGVQLQEEIGKSAARLQDIAQEIENLAKCLRAADIQAATIVER